MRHAAILLLVAAAASAQDLTVTAPPQKRAVLIVNATIHPVSGPAIPKGHVLFEKGRIVSLGTGIPDVAGEVRRIDGTGKHVYPGLIGAYTQLGLTEIGAVRASHDFREVGPVTPEVRAMVAVNPDSTLIPVTRLSGILLVGVFPSRN